MGRNALAVVPQVPPDQPSVSGKNIRLGDGSVDVTAEHKGKTYTTVVSTELDVALTIGHTIPRGVKVSSVSLNGGAIKYTTRNTNRGQEVLVDAPETGTQTLVVGVR